MRWLGYGAARAASLGMSLLAVSAGGAPPAWAAPTPELARVATQVALDVLERFCTPYSDISSLFPGNTSEKATRAIAVRTLLDALGLEERDAESLARVLKDGGIEEFEIVWEPQLTKGVGKEGFVRKSRLSCRAKAPGKEQERYPAHFRVFVMRGQP